MLKGHQSDIQKPTPFTLLLAIYGSKLAVRMTGWEQLGFAKQCEYLYPEKIDSKSKRKKVISDLIKNEKDLFKELETKSYLRIHIKYILKKYYRESVILSQDTEIEKWNQHQIMISFITHLISIAKNEDTKKAANHPKVWEFADYLKQYFIDENYNGNTFLDAFSSSKTGNNQQKEPQQYGTKPTKGYGLMMMKKVCTKYGLKSGPFSKVKKQCNIWAQQIHQQSKGVLISRTTGKKIMTKQLDINDPIYTQSFDPDLVYSIPHNVPPANYSKFVTHIPDNWVDESQEKNNKNKNKNNNNNNNQKKNNENVNNGKKWYWFNDNGGFKWIPYKQIDINRLNQAWANNEKSCLIINGEYRVEFDYTNPSTPAGNQYNNKQQNPGGRTVICSEPKAEIHGIPCAQQPL